MKSVQEIYIKACKLGEYHGRKIHDDGHTAHLVYDEHDGAQDTQALASKTDFKIMVGCVDVQLAVDWQEELNGNGDGHNHS